MEQSKRERATLELLKFNFLNFYGGQNYDKNKFNR